MAVTHDKAREAVMRLRLPGVLLGIGLGGFADGIVLHQILQWHHMLTSEGSYPATTVAGLETNTLWDGLFHAATWMAVASGLWILWQRAGGGRWAIVSGRAFVGWMLVGWGLFNVVEGVVDHHVLGIHHVRTGDNERAWDLAFLGAGAVLLMGGWLLVRVGPKSISTGGGGGASSTAAELPVFRERLPKTGGADAAGRAPGGQGAGDRRPGSNGR